MSAPRGTNSKGRTKPRSWKINKKHRYALEIAAASLAAAYRMSIQGIIRERDLPDDIEVSFDGERFTEGVGD